MPKYDVALSEAYSRRKRIARFARSPSAACCARLRRGVPRRRLSSRCGSPARSGGAGATRRCLPKASDWRWHWLRGFARASGSSSGRPTARNGSSWSTPAPLPGWCWSRRTRPTRCGSFVTCSSNREPWRCSWSMSTGGNPMAEIGAQAVDGLGAVREVVDMNDAAALHAVAGSAAAQASPHVSAGDAAQIQYTRARRASPRARC